MSVFRTIRAGLRTLFRREVVDGELHEEMRHYVEMAAQENVARGMTPGDAERAARIQFGGMAATRDRVRSAAWERVVETILQDVHYGIRQLLAAPGYALLAIGTLSLGLAIATAVITTANTVLRERWAVAEPSRVYLAVVGRGGPSFTPAAVRVIGERTRALGSLVAARCVGGLHADCHLDVNGAPAMIDLVSGNYFSALRIPLRLGRGFVPDEDQVDDPRAVVVISDAMWRARFAANPSIVGKRVAIDDVPFTVVGVAASGFIGTRTEPRDAWVPMAALLSLRPNRAAAREQVTTPSPDVSEVAVAVRLASGVTRARAEAELNAAVHTFRSANGLPDRTIRLTPTTLFPNPAKQRLATTLFSLLFAAAVLVLVLACANVGNLLLARAAARRREIAIRLALGASRGRVVRQLLVESSVLAAMSGVLGIVVAYRVPAAIMSGAMGELAWHFVPNGGVLAAAVVLTAATCIAFGLAPALHATRADVATATKGGAEAMRTGRLSLRSHLLAVQVAVSVVLLVNAGLLIRSLESGRDRDIGFRTAGVSAISVTLPASYDSARTAAFARGLMSANSSFGATSVAFVQDVPLDEGRRGRIRLPGESEQDARAPWILEMSPGTLGLLDLPLAAGRDLREQNDQDAVLVNEALARQLWPGERALGKTIIDDSPRRVVGVVKDAALFRLDRVEGVVFRPLRLGSVPVMLARGGSSATVNAVTQVAARLDAHSRVRVDSLAANVDRQLGPSRTAAELASALGVLALVLATVGVLGVFSFVVQQRTREIGIRVALGASAHDVLSVVLRDNVRAAAMGLGAGFVLAVGASRVLENQLGVLSGVSVLDPLALAGSAAVLVIAGLVATYAPARRAMRVDPIIALRHE